MLISANKIKMHLYFFSVSVVKHSDGKHLKEEVGYIGFWFQRNGVESIRVRMAAGAGS